MTDWTNPNDPDVIARLTRDCTQCHAAPGQPCINAVTTGPLPGRLVHYGR